MPRSVTTFTRFLFLAGICSGCLPSVDSPVDPPIEVSLTPTPVRAARRAYTGAPPVIPHPPLGASCTTCHSAVGQAAPPLGFAPPNPHLKTPGIGHSANCRQCHLFQRTEQSDLFRASRFVGHIPPATKGERLYPTAPPVIPHQHFMRENCAACHTGPPARPEIRCSHPDRINCAQCHLRNLTSTPPALTYTHETSLTHP